MAQSIRVPPFKYYFPADSIERIITNIRELLEGGSFLTQAEYARKFEEKFAEFVGTKYAVSVSSGTAALEIILRAIDIKGHEVIVPTNTFAATAYAVIEAGGKPVFVDIEADLNFSIRDIRRRLSPRTKAIIPVHLYGQPANMDELKEIADEHGLIIIEDACQAHGAEYKGRRTGSIGDIAAFSFFPSKNLTVAGDGGMIVTNNEEYALKAAALRDQGRVAGKKYEHDYIGFNYRMSEILAAIGRVQLKHLPEWIEGR